MQRHSRREQKVVCGLRQVRSLRMLIRARTTTIFGMPNSAVQVLLAYATTHTQPPLQSTPLTYRLFPLGYEMLLPVVALAHAAQAIAWTAL